MYLQPPLRPPQCKIIGAYCASNHRLAIEIERWSSLPISRDNILCRFCSYNEVDIEAHFVLECSLYNPIGDKLPSLFENVVLESLMSFFRLDQQLDISLYLTEATTLRRSKNLASLKPSRRTSNSITLLLPGLLNQFHFISMHVGYANPR